MTKCFICKKELKNYERIKKGGKYFCPKHLAQVMKQERAGK